MSNDEETPSKAATAPIFQTITEPKELRNVVENDIYLLGGQVAILCQFAHPALAKGSYKHSSFATRIPQRLRNTARFLNAAVCGTPEEKHAIFSVIHKYHARVKGDDYDANDPELHKWTAATLFFGIILVREAFFGKMSDAEMEVLLKESAIFGTSLRMPPEMWPATLAEFWTYWDHNIATLEVTDMARKLSRDLLYPTNLPLGVAASMPLARIITVNWLPERLALEYDLQPTPASRVAYQAFVASTRLMYPWIPQSIKQRQHDIYMEDLRKAVRRIKQTGHWVGA
jgi:uncharacterized protein (DUF2236 family)